MPSINVILKARLYERSKHMLARLNFKVNLALTGTTGLILQRVPRLATLYILL
jgi:hypothetical protein